MDIVYIMYAYARTRTPKEKNAKLRLRLRLDVQLFQGIVALFLYEAFSWLVASIATCSSHD